MRRKHIPDTPFVTGLREQRVIEVAAKNATAVKRIDAQIAAALGQIVPPVKLKMWTAERDALIFEHWPIGTPPTKLLEMLMALPGLRIPDRNRIGIRASKLGLSRPLAAGKSPPAPRTVSPPEPKDCGDSVEAGFDQIAEWAREHFVRFSDWDDLKPVNAVREKYGEPRFKRAFRKLPIRRDFCLFDQAPI